MKKTLSPVNQVLESRLLEFNKDKREVGRLIERFNQLALNIVVGDQKVAKLCEVMSNIGCITFQSCEGHGKKLPQIMFFQPEKLITLMRVVDIIRNSVELYFPWQIRVNGGLNSSPKLSYVLEPSQQYGQIKLPEDYEKLMVDIDLITLKILEVFEKPLSHEEENEDVTKPTKLF